VAAESLTDNGSEPATPRIAAIIPLYNGEKYIGDALASVFSQHLQPAEIVVVDDGSTDGGPGIVERMADRYPIRLMRKRNGGQSSARNHGVAHTTSELIALLDQDDIWYPDHLEKLVKPFGFPRSSELGWAYSNLDEIDEGGNVIARSILTNEDRRHPKRTLSICLREDMFILPSASLISRKAFETVSGFDERLRGYEDDDLFLRIFRAGFDNIFVDVPLSQWRMHWTSSGYSPSMAKSRMIYARKLLTEFPDDPRRNLYYARDLLAPRFYPQMVAECKTALRSGDESEITASFENLKYVAAFLPKSRPLTDPDVYLISAIIPLYNGAPYIEQAIRSVLAQTLLPTELIVVDDGSTDRGPEIVEQMAAERPARLPIKLLRKANGGQSSARNFGVRHAHGDLIAFLDQDDVWYPDHLRELIKPFGLPRASELGWAYSNLDEIDESGNVIARSILVNDGARHPKRTLSVCLREDMFVRFSASLISRKAFDTVGGFDEQLCGYEDDDLFLRIFRAGFDNTYLDMPLAQWRMHWTSAVYSPQTAKSRMIYARKLLAEFPDDPKRDLHYARDLLAPRFHPQMVAECKAALRSGDANEINESFANLRQIAGFLPRSRPHTDPTAWLITAIIPLYNGAQYIEEAIRSVLAQTLLPIELIVVDDGSTDRGPQIVERLAAERPARLPIKLLRKANGGQSSARNFGVRHASGDLIAFLDQDDIWYRDHLARLVTPFLEPRSAELGWVYSDLDEIDEDGNMITRSFLSTMGTQHPKRELFACLREDMFVLPSASLISRRALQAVGGFDERLMGYEDDDLFLRIFRYRYDNVYLAERLSQWRIYLASSSYSPRMARSRAIYAKKLIDTFPDNPERSRYVRRDLLAPRFLPQMIGDYRKALRYGSRQQIRAALDNLRFISRYLRLRARILFAILLPLLRFQPLAKALFAARGVAQPAVRWALAKSFSGKSGKSPDRPGAAAADPYTVSAFGALAGRASGQPGNASPASLTMNPAE
jgi:glycosyltransferase involved in cell wall biosynthesis